MERNILHPPLGLKPRWLRDEERSSEIINAMLRYSTAGMVTPKEWILELNDLILDERFLLKVQNGTNAARNH